MTTPQQIVDLIDAGLGHSGGGMGPIDQHRCGRASCKQAPVAGHDFCAACLAWLRFEVDDDPLAKPAPAPAVSSFAPAGLVEAEDDDWYWALLAAATGYCFALLSLFRCTPGSLLACRRRGWWSWAATILEGRRHR